MGVINETLKLTDHFSAAFQTFIQMGSRSAGTAQALQESTDQYARTSQYAAQQLDALKGVLASQESLYAAQGQRLDAQRQNWPPGMQNWPHQREWRPERPQGRQRLWPGPRYRNSGCSRQP